MKANEAPEKIYLEREKETDRIHHLWGRTPVISSLYEHIEYTRTDDFVEKALAYLNEKFYFNNLHYAIENNTFNCMEEMYDDFRKYMNGE